MNPIRPQPPRDEEIEAHLARRYHDTSPEFEARWVALKREMRAAPPARRPAWREGWTRWFAVGGAVAAVLLTLALWRLAPGEPKEGTVSPALAELFAMEAVLGRATPLLDAENRDVLLHLPAAPQPRS